MNNALWMDKHIYPFRGNIKKVICLYHLKPLVHKSCRVYSNLFPHLPVRVPEGILWLHIIQFADILTGKGPSRGRKDYPSNLRVPVSFNTLEHCTMFAINRKDSHP